jgi:catechol 2,3-dioxygenase-like lactoylglutathione lyase family enzyme
MKSNQLVPELSVFNFERSLKFYTDLLGFSVAYQRPEEGFAFLTLDEVQIMIDEIGKSRTWKTAELDLPLGRGINFQIEVKNIDLILESLKQNNIPLFLDVEDKWYRVNNHDVGNRQFLVQDPDGYLLRFTQDLGQRNNS